MPEARIWERSTGESMVGSRVGSCVCDVCSVFVSVNHFKQLVILVTVISTLICLFKSA